MQNTNGLPDHGLPPFILDLSLCLSADYASVGLSEDGYLTCGD